MMGLDIQYYLVLKNIMLFISQKSGITYIISNTFALMKIDSYNPLPSGKTLILDNVIILIKLVFKKDQNHY